MKRLRYTCVATAALALGAPAAAPAAVEKVSFGNFTAPVFVTSPPGDPTRVFVVERSGVIQVVSSGVRKQFLDISSTVDTAGERGLLSMAFAPDYATSGLFYVFDNQKATGNVRVEEFQRSAADPDQADVSSRRIVLDEAHGQGNHNGGQLQFGPDGYLYVSIGDNENGANSQQLANVLGKVLRIDPRAGHALVPSDNPFAGTAGARGEIWLWGLRNPWRFSFDTSAGTLVVGDVGSGSREEIDLGAKGGNYGWPNCEGFCSPANPSYTDPALAYDHTASRCAITGGYVVHADDLPSLAGRYLYGDYCAGTMRSAALANPVTDDRPESPNVPNLVSFGEDACGHIFAVAQAGTVWRLSESSTPAVCSTPPAPPAAPVPEPQPTPTPIAAPADTKAPVLRLSFRSRQRAARRRAVILGAGCSEPCSIRAAGTVSGTGAGHAPRLVATAARAQPLRLAITRRGAARIRRALRRHKRVFAVVRVAATDGAGNAAAPKTVRVRITG